MNHTARETCASLIARVSDVTEFLRFEVGCPETSFCEQGLALDSSLLNEKESQLPRETLRQNESIDVKYINDPLDT
jgi:hypothetical protein